MWDGEQLLFTHIHANAILRCDVTSGAISPWRGDTNRTNGLAFDAHGTLFGCCSGGRSLLRFDTEGRNTVIADRVDVKRLSTPNDLAIERSGRIWFTNPVNAGNWDATESGYTQGIPRELRAYPILADGALGSYTTLFTWGEDARGVHRGIDGMCLDRDGNIVATAGWEVAGAGPMIYVFSPTGRVLETHPVPAIRPTNCAFAGPDLTTLFVTTTQGHLFRVRTQRVGWSMYP